MNEENEVTEYEPDSLESALADAWDNTEDDNNVNESNESTENENNAVNNIPEQSESAGISSNDQESIRSQEEQIPQSNENANSDEIPPVSMSVDAKEEWKNTPKAMQDYVKKFEERQNGLAQKWSKGHERAEKMDKALAPYSQLMSMNGGAGNVLPGLLQTASQLQMGSNQQKAFAVASIIKQYDIDIKTLDSLLVGEAPSQADQQKEFINQQVQQQMAPLQQHYQQQQQQQQYYQQQEQQRIGGEVSNFGQQNEFYQYVALDMADKLDQAASQGIQMTMDEAYTSACWGNEKIRKIMQDRDVANHVTNQKKANTSIRGTKGGEMSSSAPNSVEAALNEAWDNAGRM